MDLSTELFEQTIRHLKGQAAYGPQDQRNHPRLGLRYRMRIIPVEDGALGTATDIWTRDISRSGLGLISSRRMRPGDRFVLLLPREPGESAISLMCIVRNCDDLLGGCFGVGASFEAQGRGANAGANSPAADGKSPAAA